jgi:hypothetical protein
MNPLGSAEPEVGDVEADEGDHVVLHVPAAGSRVVVDREEQVRVQAVPQASFTSFELNFAPASFQSQTGVAVEQSQPFRIQPAMIVCPLPPCEPSMLIIWKPPGPTFPYCNCVATPKHGQPLPLTLAACSRPRTEPTPTRSRAEPRGLWRMR